MSTCMMCDLCNSRSAVALFDTRMCCVDVGRQVAVWPMKPHRVVDVAFRPAGVAFGIGCRKYAGEATRNKIVKRGVIIDTKERLRQSR